MMTYCLVYLASPRAFHHGTDSRFDCLAASLRSARACLPEMPPVIIFHEDYTEADQATLSAIVSPQHVHFEQVDFSIGDDDYVQRRWSKGYLLMCRFFSGDVQRHPALQGYSHYMRLDDDSYFINPKVQPSEIRRMLRADYSYRQHFYESATEVASLYQFTLDFLRKEGRSIPRHNPQIGQGVAIYNNFHLASLRFWNHILIEHYIDALEAEKGCLRHSWLDANIHTMIVCLLVPHTGLTVNVETQFGYRHNHHYAVSGSLETRVNDGPFIVEPNEYI